MVYDDSAKPSVTVDMVVFTIIEGKLNVMIR
jgi:hypothetical protein